MEAVLALAVAFPVLFLQVEVLRRGWCEVALAHTAFLTARESVIGGSGCSQKRGREFWRQAFVHARVPDLHLHQTGRHRVARAALRYPAFWTFPWAGRIKHHFEITRRCRFPYLP